MAWKDILKKYNLLFYLKEWYHWMIKDRKVTYFNVKRFLDEAVSTPIQNMPKFKGKDYDKKIVEIQKWVENNITYNRDSFNYGVKEYWAMPNETLIIESGDCEDGAILIYTLARHNQIPSTQLKIHGGNVEWNGKTGGHCWLEYYSPDLDNTYIIDWCFNINTNELKERLSANRQIHYIKRWWEEGVSDFNLK